MRKRRQLQCMLLYVLVRLFVLVCMYVCLFFVVLVLEPGFNVVFVIIVEASSVVLAVVMHTFNASKSCMFSSSYRITLA